MLRVWHAFHAIQIICIMYTSTDEEQSILPSFHKESRLGTTIVKYTRVKLSIIVIVSLDYIKNKSVTIHIIIGSFCVKP